MNKKGAYFSCLICGKKFWRKLYLVKKGNNKFCSKICYFKWQKGRPRSEEFRKKCGSLKGRTSPLWKGGKSKTPEGYIKVYFPTHPLNVYRYVLEHRLVMERMIGRYLLPNEIVHHKNGIKDDNRPENLMLFINEAEHKYWHTFKRKQLFGGAK